MKLSMLLLLNENEKSQIMIVSNRKTSFQKKKKHDADKIHVERSNANKMHLSTLPHVDTSFSEHIFIPAA